MKVLATYSIKGGVGKTSTAVNLAAVAARSGLRTLVWDLDPQGAATFLFRVRNKVPGGGARLVDGRTDALDLLKGTDIDGLDLLPADLSYRHLDIVLSEHKRPTERLERVLRPLRGHYDLVVLDCAPSISQVSESVFHAADALLVPVIPTPLSLRTFDQLCRFLERKVADPPRVLGFFSMVDRRRPLHRDAVAEARDGTRAFAATVIPATTHVEAMGARRMPVSQFAPRAAVVRAYRELWREVHDRLS